MYGGVIRTFSIEGSTVQKDPNDWHILSIEVIDPHQRNGPHIQGYYIRGSWTTPLYFFLDTWQIEFTFLNQIFFSFCIFWSILNVK
jgi:hypothetical protein